MRFRFRLVMGLMAAGFLAVTARLAYLQVWRHRDLSQRAQSQAERWVRDAPRRAPIRDRHGDVLVDSVRVASCYADPRLLPHPDTTAQRLAKPLRLSASEITERIRRAPGAFVWLKRRLGADESRAIEEENLRGIGLQWEYRRFYPNGDLAGPLLGVVGEDGRGLSGLEYAFNKELMDPRPPLRALRDGRGRRLMETSSERPSAGGLRLSIDRKIQFIAERELDTALRRAQARSGIVVVQDPWTGEILAMAGRPAVSLTSESVASPEELMVRAVQWSFEPGSTFKVVTAAAALENKSVRPGELINCESGKWKYADVEINDHEPEKIITFARSMEVSSNIALSKVGLRVGKEKMYDTVRAFGFGSRTGFDLPGEAVGLLKPPSQWSGVTLPILSFGQEVGVTALQLAGAFSAIANGGRLLEPHVCLDADWPSGETPRWPVPTEVRRVMSPETAATLTTFMEGVVLKGTGVDAVLPGWQVAGKTGTAQKIDPRTRAYSREKYVASFAGFAPSRRPRLTIVVIIDEPKGLIWGGYNAAPVFKNIAWQALSLLGVPTDEPPPPGPASKGEKKR
ncbi:MAG: penicillin-binding protein 2 [Elusimicrobia bacterium]|nr:penicillin-binding protein 2 [Elusimicrobiota bacterium]MBP9127180.1 penicillin-binding protein 2 [Elusimicrobiota bacterium]MBP9698787.1 penicillin-binding protein 2 [Elusimicrobiota bacterium]